jgi:hypothetical protein
MAARSDVVRSARVAQAAKKRTATARYAVQIGVEASAQFRCQIRGITKAAGSRASGPPQPKPAIYQNPKAPDVLMIRAVAAIAEFDLIGNWEHEMLKYGQAIIHHKIVVIDPLSDDCVVVTAANLLASRLPMPTTRICW